MKLRANSKLKWEGEPPIGDSLCPTGAVWCFFCKRYIAERQIEKHSEQHQHFAEGWEERYDRAQKRSAERSFSLHGSVEKEPSERKAGDG